MSLTALMMFLENPANMMIPTVAHAMMMYTQTSKPAATIGSTIVSFVGFTVCVVGGIVVIGRSRLKKHLTVSGLQVQS